MFSSQGYLNDHMPNGRNKILTPALQIAWVNAPLYVMRQTNRLIFTRFPFLITSLFPALKPLFEHLAIFPFILLPNYNHI